MFEGTVVKAEEQYEGRGQRGNNWKTEAGKNLTFSILLFPTFLRTTEQFFLSEVVSLGVTDMLKAVSGENFSIKWPNDILFEEQKICGILIENSIRKNSLQNSIAGVGVNINQMEFSNELNATSLKKICGRDFENERLFKTLCGFIEKRYLQLRGQDSTLIEEEYHQRLFGLNELRSFKKDNKTFEAVIRGVKPNGELKLELENGEKRSFRFKEVEFLM